MAGQMEPTVYLVIPGHISVREHSTTPDQAWMRDHGPVKLFLGALVLLPMLALAIGAVTGRVRARSCCAVADPERDLRTRPPNPR